MLSKHRQRKWLPRYSHKCVFEGVVDMLTHAAEESPSTAQVLAEVQSVLAVSCYSGFGGL